MRYTFPQTYEEFRLARSQILARLTWVRPVMIGLVVLCVVMAIVPLIGGGTPTVRGVILSVVPYLILIALWIGLLSGRDRLALIGMGLLVVILTVATGQYGSIGVIIMNLLPYAFILGVFALVPYLVRRQFNSSPIFHGDMTVELLPDELKVVRETSTSTYRWPSLVRAAETPEFFLLFIMKGAAIYIPKRVIPSADLDNLRGFLRSHVPSGMI